MARRVLRRRFVDFHPPVHPFEFEKGLFVAPTVTLNRFPLFTIPVTSEAHVVQTFFPFRHPFLSKRTAYNFPFRVHRFHRAAPALNTTDFKIPSRSTSATSTYPLLFSYLRFHGPAGSSLPSLNRRLQWTPSPFRSAESPFFVRLPSPLLTILPGTFLIVVQYESPLCCKTARYRRLAP